MPVTARLSRKFYETFGDDIANELVEWFNQVDATYRADLREFNELNFQRFDAKLEQRLSEFRNGLRDELRTEFQAGLKAVRDEVVVALAEQGERLTDLRSKMEMGNATLQTKMEMGYATLQTKMEMGYATLQTKMEIGRESLKTELARYLFRFWIGTLIPLAGLIIGLHTLGN